MNTIMMNNGTLSVNNLNKQGIINNLSRAKDIINKNDNINMKIYNNIPKMKTKVESTTVGLSPYFDPSRNVVCLPNTTNDRNAGTTIHELSHAVDHYVGSKLKTNQLSLSGKLTQLIDNYFNQTKGTLPKEYYDYRQKIESKISKKIKSNSVIDILNYRRNTSISNYKYDAQNRLSDMFSALTNGKANGDLYAKHSQQYWNGIGKRETELFAQYSYLRMTNAREELKLLKNTVPDIENELNMLYTKASEEMEKK